MCSLLVKKTKTKNKKCQKQTTFGYLPAPVSKDRKDGKNQGGIDCKKKSAASHQKGRIYPNLEVHC